MHRFLRPSTRQNPISQAELKNLLKEHPELILEVQKIGMPVELTKTERGEVVHTVIVTPKGRIIFETVKTAKPGDIITKRETSDGHTERYCKNGETVTEQYYIIEGNRKLADLQPGETVKAHTVNQEVRMAVFVTRDTYIETTWGEVQLAAEGGLITFTESGEAIGNNNPCDILILEEW